MSQATSAAFGDDPVSQKAAQASTPVSWEVPTTGSQGAAATKLSMGIRNKLLAKFSGLSHGQINLFQDGECTRLGDALEPLSTDLLVRDPQFFRRVLTGGTLGSAESYMDGQWSCSDLTTLIRIMIRNIDRVSSINQAVSRVRSMLWRWKHAVRKNSIRGSKKNIAEHYDLGNEFYKLFLDPTMNYSSGIFDAASTAKKFPSASDPLHAASLAKMDRICQKLDLQPTDEVLEIGTGWGAMAVHIAGHYGCRVTTTTISEEQYRLARARVSEAGLEDRVTVLRKDYRELTGSFDKIVSIEMIEAVGHKFMKGFFAKCNSLLRDDGEMLLQAITMSPQNWKPYLRSVDFIRAYVFPGGCLPTVGSLHAAATASTDMRMLHSEDMTPHYATTLKHWKRRFLARLEDVRALGFDERLIRLWNFYLSYCEAGFAERRVHCVQMMFGKPLSPIDPVRFALT